MMRDSIPIVIVDDREDDGDIRGSMYSVRSKATVANHSHRNGGRSSRS